ncbi:hypothetical protein E2C01_032182 [Portunus trituberculatus]|uniref:Uncharacterized protein n=1 Tax=Portunus trituberculatus TaxID=210409 RepID=A0A5B7EVD2_PORTR|nr:hypothetical protein [Portunus trituberculatus]
MRIYDHYYSANISYLANLQAIRAHCQPATASCLSASPPPCHTACLRDPRAAGREKQRDRNK